MSAAAGKHPVSATMCSMVDNLDNLFRFGRGGRGAETLTSDGSYIGEMSVGVVRPSTGSD